MLIIICVATWQYAFARLCICYVAQCVCWHKMSNLPLAEDIVQQHTICNTRDRQAIRSKLLVRLHCQTMRSSTGKCQALVQNRQTLQAKIVDGGFCSLDLRTYYTIIILPISRYTMLNESNSKIEKCSENKTPAFSQQLCRSCCLRRVCLPFSNVPYIVHYTSSYHNANRTNNKVEMVRKGYECLHFRQFPTHTVRFGICSRSGRRMHYITAYYMYVVCNVCPSRLSLYSRSPHTANTTQKNTHILRSKIAGQNDHVSRFAEQTFTHIGNRRTEATAVQ